MRKLYLVKAKEQAEAEEGHTANPLISDGQASAAGLEVTPSVGQLVGYLLASPL